jgi:hypothetical protein
MDAYSRKSCAIRSGACWTVMGCMRGNACTGASICIACGRECMWGDASRRACGNNANGFQYSGRGGMHTEECISAGIPPVSNKAGCIREDASQEQCRRLPV